MKKTCKIIGTVLLAGIIFFSFGCKNKSNAQISQSNDNKVNKPNNKPEDNPFEELRNLALTTTPEQLELKLPKDKTIVYAVVMDWHLGEGIATIPIFQTGDASMYLSSGGGIIGGGTHENVKKAAVAFIDKAQIYLDKATKTDTSSPAGANSVKFYFLTNKGKFVAEEKMENFENNSSKWLELFEEANKVITELRKTAPESE